MIDTDEVRSPGWWFKRLLPKLHDQSRKCDELWQVYTNQADIPVPATKRVREAYRRLMAISRLNYAELIVEAIRQRQVPVGFRTGAEGDELGDATALRMWQANHLDADSAEVHRYSLAMRCGYVIVGPPKAPGGFPVITPEDPREVIVEHDPIDGRTVLAGLKVFDDTVDGVERAYVYVPGEVWKASRPRRKSAERASTLKGWEWDDEPEPTGFDVVTIVAFPNRSRCQPTGEFEPHLPHLHRINFQILQRLEVATLQAFRQLAIIGLPKFDPDGNPENYDDVFDREPGVLWQLPETAKLWESGVIDMGPIRQVIRDDVQDLAMATSTPLYRVTPDAAGGSATGASLQREGHISNVRDKNLMAGECWEQVMSHAFRYAGDSARAELVDLETIWQRPEYFSLAERYDAASKAQAAGVPWRFVMSDILGFTPTEIARMERELAAAPPTEGDDEQTNASPAA